MSVDSVTSQLSRLAVTSSSTAVVPSSVPRPLPLGLLDQLITAELSNIVFQYCQSHKTEEKEKREILKLLEVSKISRLSEYHRKLLSQLSWEAELNLNLTEMSSSLSEILEFTPCVQNLRVEPFVILWGGYHLTDRDEQALSTLQNLQYLCLSCTPITDSGFAVLRNLKLKSITLCSMTISGKRFGNWLPISPKELPVSPAKEIYLFRNNNLTEADLAQLGQLQGLKKFRIEDSNITGEWFVNWSQSPVETLHLQVCKKFDDESLELLADYLPNLRELILKEMGSITGLGFAKWDRSKVEKISICECSRFYEANLALLANLPNLKEITFQQMTITGEGFKDWSKSPVQKVSLDLCRGVTDTGLRWLGTLSQLQEVILDRTQITGVGFKDWSKSPIQKVSLASCHSVTDAGLRWLGTLPKLQEVILDYTNVTGEGFKGWSKSPVQKISLKGNSSVNDNGIQQLGTLPELKEVILNWNWNNFRVEAFTTWKQSSIKKLTLWSHYDVNPEAFKDIKALQDMLPNIKIETAIR